MKYGFVDLDCHTEDIRNPMEEAGFILKQSKPEEVRCPQCGKKTIYTWRHCYRTDVCMAIECSNCGLNCLTTAPIGYLNEILKRI